MDAGLWPGGQPIQAGLHSVRSQFTREATHPIGPSEVHAENAGHGTSWPLGGIYSGISSKQQLRGSGELSRRG